ncbi:D-amino-acid transaminase [Phaeovibrio sulfidiphilus]|uniref:Probable branched-chain-amino-acid aminotransferase n=1 Tax=Phaeovibrio sulfidiphilus TaxID=1220600 RepID=A0A8J7CEG5_9PROT|nr:D-amino-acid transaminase [Phaeovibrio sulfidiphilus]MBE1237714.1 D-amino-acid transaminase [Phaeovibrio sulfidiphilus]
MPRLAYVNGRYVPYRNAMVHCEDRGYQFADAVYEVLGLYRGYPVDLEGHWARLFRSLRAIGIEAPFSAATLSFIAREVVRRNRISTGTLYIQVSRGVAPRNHPFPDPDTPPGIVIVARPGLGPTADVAARGVSLLTQPDLRWKRCDIKSTGLLANVLAKQAAREQGAYEALLVDSEGMVTECSSSNVWIVDEAGAFITRPLGDAILPGVTRQVLAGLIRENGQTVVERPFSLTEALAAREVFVSSTGSFALPVVSIDGRPVGDGKPGPMVADLRARYVRRLESLDGDRWGV